jgi:hypothetical protein
MLVSEGGAVAPVDLPAAPLLFERRQYRIAYVATDFDLAVGLEILPTIRTVSARRAKNANIAPGSRRTTVDG